MIALSDVQASLSLFAEALAGTPVAFTVADTTFACWPWAVGPDVRVGSSNDQDPGERALLIPAELSRRETYRSLVLHQLLCEPFTADPHGHRVGSHYHYIYSLVEDHRVNSIARRNFPGDTPSLDDVLADAAGRYVALPSEPIAALVRRHVLHAGGTAIAKGARDPAMAAVPDLAALVISLIDQVTVAAATPADSHAVADRLWRFIDGIDRDLVLTEFVDANEDDDEGSAAPSEPSSGMSVDGGTPTEFEDTDGLGGGQLLSDLGDDIAAAVEPSDKDRAPGGLTLPMTPAGGGAGEVRTFVYDEWDFHVGEHRRAWCRVVEERLVGDDHTFINEVRGRHQKVRSQIRRSLLKLRPRELVRVHRSDDGDELDLDAAIEATIDRRAGAPVDDRVRIRRDRAARDVATAFLVDLSASTSSPAVPAEPEPLPVNPDPFDDPMSYGPIWDAPPVTEPVRRVIDVAKDAVALMGDTLHELGDRFAIYGFSGTGRESVDFKIGKDFSDRLTSASWAAVAAMKPLRYTRMGPAVRHATAKLAAESARTRLLVVISDGYPQDTDYGNDRTDRDYGLHDTARALADANAAGIETFCVTIDPAGHDYLRVMCAPDRYSVIDDVEALPEELANVYLLTLRG